MVKGFLTDRSHGGKERYSSSHGGSDYEKLGAPNDLLDEEAICFRLQRPNAKWRGSSKKVIDVFIDESGDLGFSQKATDTFVVACVIVEDPVLLSRKIRKLMREINGRSKKEIYEFKYSNDSPEVRSQFIELINSSDIGFSVIGINKRLARSIEKSNVNELYSEMVVKCLLETSLRNYRKVNATVDRKRGENVLRNFEAQLNAAMNLPRGSLHSLKITVRSSNRDSRDDKCLQVADYIAAACFQKTENGLDDAVTKITHHSVAR